METDYKQPVFIAMEVIEYIRGKLIVKQILVMDDYRTYRLLSSDLYSLDTLFLDNWKERLKKFAAGVKGKVIVRILVEHILEKDMGGVIEIRNDSVSMIGNFDETLVVDLTRYFRNSCIKYGKG